VLRQRRNDRIGTLPGGPHGQGWAWGQVACAPGNASTGDRAKQGTEADAASPGVRDAA
jgi:hypothetical protein